MWLQLRRLGTAVRPGPSRVIGPFSNVGHVSPTPPAQNYFEIDIDVHTWGQAALSGFNSVKVRRRRSLTRSNHFHISVYLSLT